MRRYMPVNRRAALLTLAFGAGTLGAQTRPSVEDTSHFRPLTLAAPNEYRTASGKPGAKYWQQRVDYRIVAEVDEVTNELRGREVIHYANHSPDTLSYIWMYVEKNLCEPNSVTNQLNQPPLVFLGTTFDFSCQGFNGTPVLESLQIGGRDVRRTRYGTTLRIDLTAALASGASIDIDAAWHFNVPAQGGG